MHISISKKETHVFLTNWRYQLFGMEHLKHCGCAWTFIL